jgi:hypothetical protein
MGLFLHFSRTPPPSKLVAGSALNYADFLRPGKLAEAGVQGLLPPQRVEFDKPVNHPQQVPFRHMPFQ